MPLVATVVLEGIILKSNSIFEFIIERIGFWSRSESFPKKYEEVRVVDVPDIFLLFSRPEFWIGIIISALLVVGIVYTRSTNNDYTVE